SIVFDSFFELFLSEVSCALIAIERSGAWLQPNRLLVLLDVFPELLFLLINYAKVVDSLGILMVEMDGPLKILAGFFIALHQQLRDASFVTNARIVRLLGQNCPIVIEGVEVVLLNPQFIAPLFELFHRGARRRGRGASDSRRTDLHQFRVRSLGLYGGQSRN